VPPAPLPELDAGDIVRFGDVLWRIRRTTGPYLTGWNELRAYGPLASMRWDPHPGPAAAHSNVGVMYAASELDTALAETYQQQREIDVKANLPHATAWMPTRPLRLLDLTTASWLLHAQASAALPYARRDVCRNWARNVHARYPSLDGLLVPSTLTGRPCVVLWSPAGDSFPKAPGFDRALAHPGMWTVCQAVAAAIGYGING
jgi:hypothetical protein